MEFGVNSILTFIICYLIGSFPTGYFFVKTSCKKDITKEGSGNVGTYNALQVSGSKAIGIIVLIIGHNFSIWLKFKGGRGLAAGAGIFAVLNFWILVSWCLVWVIFYLFKKNVLLSNFFATLFLPLFAIFIINRSGDDFK